MRDGRRWAVVTVTLAVSLVAFARAQTAKTPPPWAFGFDTPVPPGPPPPPNPGGRGGGGGRGQQPPPDPTVRHVPGSDQGFTVAQVRDGNNIIDWFPMDHPPMPDVVQHGRMPNVRACGLCHYPNGKGRPENASVSGLSEAYILQQLDDFKNGNRTTSDYRKNNTGIMATIAESMTPEEMKTAAKYFSSIKFTPWVTVKEVAMVPTTRIAGGLFLSKDDGMMEPIGNRIIEVPEKTENTETLRDPHSGFITYVPVGSIKKGEALVTTGGNGKTIACATCHGPDLRGLGPVPAIAGRMASYLVRQMFDMQSQHRTGLWTPLMKDVVAKLTDDDMLQIAAYVASKQP